MSFEPEGSPLFAQFIQNCRGWPEAPRFRRLPGCRKRFVQGAAFLIREVVTFIIRNEVDYSPIGQSRGLVEHDAPLRTCALSGLMLPLYELQRSLATANNLSRPQGSFSISSPGRRMPPSRNSGAGRMRSI